jgi:hypothetical protein
LDDNCLNWNVNFLFKTPDKTLRKPAARIKAPIFMLLGSFLTFDGSYARFSRRYCDGQKYHVVYDRVLAPYPFILLRKYHVYGNQVRQSHCQFPVAAVPFLPDDLAGGVHPEVYPYD